MNGRAPKKKCYILPSFLRLVRVSSMSIVIWSERQSIRPEIFVGHVTEPELATRLEVSIGSPCLLALLPSVRNRTRRVVSDYCEQGRRVSRRYRNLTNSRFATSRRDNSAIYSTYTRRILSACGAPSAVWTAFTQDSPSPFCSFTDSRGGNTVFRKCSASFHFVRC